jgi:hypothetical protein
MMMTFRKSLIITGGTLFFGALMYLGAAPALAADPATTTVPPTDPNASCLSCHNAKALSMTFQDGELLSLYVDNAQFQASKHGPIVSCAVCHPAEIAGNDPVIPHPVVKAANLKDYRAQQYQICWGCHTQEYKDLQASVHGNQTGTQIATCADCHTAHDTLATGYFPASDSQDATAINTYRLQSVTDCNKCHGNDDLMRQYGISTNVVNSYLQDFHGKTTYLIGEQAKNLSIKTAVCSDCHRSSNGISLSTHALQLITPSNQATIQQSFTAACAQCHPGASVKFAAAYLSHKQPSATYAQVDFGVTWFYRVMIAFVLIGLFIHIGFDIYKRQKNKKAKEV